MRNLRRAFMALGTAWVVVACGGNPFGSEDDDTPATTGGTASDAGASGRTNGEAGEGVGASAAAGVGGDKDTGGGGASSGGGGASSGGGMAPGAGGSEEGGAGAGPAVMEPVFTMSKLIDDMEDGNATLLGTNGDWFVFKDATEGIITPPKDVPFTMSVLSPARGASKRAASVTVSAFTDWGAAFGFDFEYVGNARQPVTLGPALAVRFWSKASKATTLRFQMPNADTDLAGGKCSGTGNNACGAHWSKTFKVGTEWQQTTILLADLAQDLPGRHVPTFDKENVYSAFFVIGPNQALTVWVDDMALVH